MNGPLVKIGGSGHNPPSLVFKIISVASEWPPSFLKDKWGFVQNLAKRNLLTSQHCQLTFFDSSFWPNKKT